MTIATRAREKKARPSAPVPLPERLALLWPSLSVEIRRALERTFDRVLRAQAIVPSVIVPFHVIVRVVAGAFRITAASIYGSSTIRRVTVPRLLVMALAAENGWREADIARELHRHDSTVNIRLSSFRARSEPPEMERLREALAAVLMCNEEAP